MQDYSSSPIARQAGAQKSFSRPSIGLRLMVVAGLMLMLVATVAIYSIWQLASQVEDERRGQAKQAVEMAANQISHIHALELIGALTPEQAQAQALDLIASTRFINGSYLWVHDFSGYILAHPMQPQLVHQSRDGTLPPEIKDLFISFNQQVSAHDGVFVTYDWPKPGEIDKAHKVSYLKKITPWGWVIGSGIYLDDVDEVLWQRGFVLISFSAGVGVVGIWIILLMVMGILRPIKRAEQRMLALARGGASGWMGNGEYKTDLSPKHGLLSEALSEVEQRIMALRRRQVETEAELIRTTAALDTVSDGVMVTNAKEQIIKVNRAFTQLTGYSLDDALGKKPSLLSSGRHNKAFYDGLWTTLRNEGHWSGEIWNRGKNGRVYPEVLTINAIYDGHRNVIGYVGAFSDVTEGKRQAEKVQWYSEHDVLTGLFNRRTLEYKAPLLLRGAVSSGQVVAVILIDIDDFKVTNDTHGFVAGDRVLQTLARRLKDFLGGDVLLARLGGDEFACIIPSVSSRVQVRKDVEKLLDELARPISIDGIDIVHTVCIGWVFAPDHATLFDDALRIADRCLGQAKQSGRGLAVQAEESKGGTDYSI